MDKLLKYSDQQFRKQIIYRSIRKYGVTDVTEMLGLGFDQDSLTYAYSNKEDVYVPNERWDHFKCELSLRGDKSIVREDVDPRVLVSITSASKTNGVVNDEIENVHILLGKILEAINGHEDLGPADTDMIKKWASSASDEIATLIQELS